MILKLYKFGNYKNYKNILIEDNCSIKSIKNYRITKFIYLKRFY